MIQSLIKTCFLPILFFSFIACGGSKSSSVSTVENNESTLGTKDYGSYSVATIVNCGQGVSTSAKTFSLFPNIKSESLSTLNFSSWNHTTNGNKTEWTNLKLAANNYNFEKSPTVNSSCNNVHTLDIVLLKKIADWNHQHSNGFECNVLAQGYKFGDIKNLVFDLKINSTKTNIPNIESLKSIYGSYVNESIINALEDGRVNIGITLGDNTNLNGSIIFQLDKAILNDKWVRVTIPINKLTFYQEINYKRTSKTFADLSNLIINRVLVVGETKNGAVLRGNINPWSANVPETFKEMDLSFKKIEFQLK